MLTYNFEWEKDGKTGSFKVNAMSDEECVKVGHHEVKRFGAEVTDYYLVTPSFKKKFKKINQSSDLRELITKRTKHATNRVNQLKEKHGDDPGNTHTYFGGQSLGYWEGRLSAFEDILEELEKAERAEGKAIV